jgi:hypothetical protein
MGIWIHDALEARHAFDFTPHSLNLNESGRRLFAKLNIEQSIVRTRDGLPAAPVSIGANAATTWPVPWERC